MKIITNNQIIRRNRLIGQTSTIASLVILGSGLVMSFQPHLINWSFLALIVGFLLSQIGIYFGSRWGRSPRPDEKINQALKGLDNKFSLYHYTVGVAHLISGPAGVWVLLPFHQGGTITYSEEKNRWKQKGGNLYLKVFAQESLGRPDLEVQSAMNDAQRILKSVLGDQEIPEPQVALVFTNPKANLDAANAPYPTLHLSKLKDFLRQKARENPAEMEKIQLLQKALPQEQ